MQAAVNMTLLSYGQGRHSLSLTGGGNTVGEAIRQTGLTTQGRRVALNGRPADAGSKVMEGDVVTLMPRVVGG